MSRSHNNHIKVKNNIILDLNSLLKMELSNCLDEIKLNNFQLMDHYDPEILHNTRVSLRRIKSLLRFFKKEISSKNWKTATSMINKLISPTSEIRDFDVISSNYIFPACGEYKYLQESRILLNESNAKLIRLHKNIVNIVSSSQYLQLLKDLQFWASTSEWQTHSSFVNVKGSSFGALIENKLNKKYKSIELRIHNITQFDQKSLHRIRIDVKELRYLIEFFKLNIKKSMRHLNKLKHLQDALGTINDTYIAEKLMRESSMKGSDKIKRHISTLSAHQRTRCIHKIITYI